MKLTQQQWKVLRFYLDPAEVERVRAVWMDDDERVIGPVAEPFAYSPSAFVVKVYRLADNAAETFKGDALGRTYLSVADLRALEPCWTAPLRSLSPLGVELASKPWDAPEPPLALNAKLPADLWRWVRDTAQAERCTMTEIAVRALNQLRDSRQ